MADFGAYITGLRKKKKLSLRAVAAITGMSYSYLTQIEHGKRNPPRPELLKRLAPVYGVSVRDLLKVAGHLDDIEPVTPITPILSEEEEVEMAFRYVMNDPRYESGTRVTGPLTLEVKRFIVEMYEKATGKKLLPGG